MSYKHGRELARRCGCGSLGGRRAGHWRCSVRTTNNQVLLAMRRDPAILARFWSNVERPDDKHACWEWRGRCSRDGLPAFHIGQARISPARVAWLWSTGDFPLGGRVHRRCENPLCVRPGHLAWIVGSIMARRLSAESDGYLPLSGVTTFVAGPPGHCRRTVRVTGIAAEAETAPELPRSVCRQGAARSQRAASSA